MHFLQRRDQAHLGPSGLPVRVSIEDNRSDGSLGDGSLILGGDDDHGTLRVPDEDELGLRASAEGGGDSAGKISSTLSRSSSEVGGGSVAMTSRQSISLSAVTRRLLL